MGLDVEIRSGMNRVTWWVFYFFLIAFPVVNGLPLQRLPSGMMSLVLLVVFVLFLVLSMTAQRIAGRAEGREVARRAFGVTEWLVVGFGALALLASMHSVDPRTSLWGVAGEYGGLVPTIAYVIVFLWVSKHVEVRWHRTLLIGIAIASVLPSLYGVLQHTHWLTGIPYQSRSTSFFCNADFYGTYTALVLLVTLVLYVTEQRLTRFAYLLLILLQFVALLYSSTRSAWVGGLVGVLFFGSLAIMRNHTLWKRLLLLVVGVALVFAIVNLQSHNQTATRVSSIASNAKQVVTNQQINYVASSRWYIWKESIPIIWRHPWLGTGPDTFEQVFQPSSRGLALYLNGSPVANANNAYLQKAVTMGIPALIVLVALYMRLLVVGWRRRHGDGQVESYLLRVGLMAAVISYLVQAFFNMDVVMVTPLFWVVLGMLHRGSMDAGE